MAPFRIICRCDTCVTFSHTDAQGKLIVGREWNKKSVTYIEHLKKSSIKPLNTRPSLDHATSSHNRFNNSEYGAADHASHPPKSPVAQKSTNPPVPVPSDSRDVQQIPDPKLTLWKGATIDCARFLASCYGYYTKTIDPKCLARVLLCACQYMFLNLSHGGINKTLACLKGFFSGLPIPPNQLYLPIDIRTVIKDLNLEPPIERTVCCPRCFHLYPIDSPPKKCTARATRRSRKCFEPLYKPASGTSSSVPMRRYFSTQSFTTWLARFLTRPGIEELLAQSLTSSLSSDTSDIWDSNMWKNLKTVEGEPFTSSPGNLVFSLNVDWFNPSGNKIAGKHISVGTIALVCLNLPPDHRTSHENIFLAGLIPGPSEPTLTDINHVLGPLVKELKELWTGVKFNSTFDSCQDGRIIKIMLGPIICDLPAIRKVIGMAGHSSNKHLCSFCHVTKQKIDIVDLNGIRPRDADVLRKQAMKWKKAATLEERKKIFKSYGVRYSILYELPYFSPLSNAVVEPMHNIFLGLLHHHGRDLFGLKMPDKKIESHTKSRRTGCFSESEDDNSLDENNSEPPTDDKGKQKEVPPDYAEELLEPLRNLDVEWATESGSDPDFDPDLLESSDQGESDDQESLDAPDCETPTDLNPLGARFFGKAENLQTLREVNKEVQLPSWIGRVPSTIGAAKGGKLKADEWVILFEIIMIPTLIRILFKSHNVFQVPMFRNVLHLTSVLNILRSLKINKQAIENLQLHLKAYRQGLLDIFPSFSTKPNHHLALHLPDCLHQFGPAPQWTAWSFERLNGSLASIPTNNREDSRDLTLLKRWVSAQNLRNLLPDLCQHLPQELAEPLLDFIKPSKSVGQFSQAMNVNRNDLSNLNYDPQKIQTLDLETHEQLVHSLKTKFSDEVDLSTSVYTSSTKSKTSILIPRLVHQHKSIVFGYETYTTSDRHAGNSNISYNILNTNGATQAVCGQISQIFTMCYSTKKGAPRQIHLWFEVERFGNLSPSDDKKHEFENWPYVRARIVYNSKKKKDYIQMDAIIGHVATWQLPRGCLGIRSSALLVVNLSKNLTV